MCVLYIVTANRVTPPQDRPLLLCVCVYVCVCVRLCVRLHALAVSSHSSNPCESSGLHTGAACRCEVKFDRLLIIVRLFRVFPASRAPHVQLYAHAQAPCKLQPLFYSIIGATTSLTWILCGFYRLAGCQLAAFGRYSWRRVTCRGLPCANFNLFADSCIHHRLVLFLREGKRWGKCGEKGHKKKTTARLSVKYRKVLVFIPS